MDQVIVRDGRHDPRRSMQRTSKMGRCGDHTARDQGTGPFAEFSRRRPGAFPDQVDAVAVRVQPLPAATLWGGQMGERAGSIYRRWPAGRLLSGRGRGRVVGRRLIGRRWRGGGGRVVGRRRCGALLVLGLLAAGDQQQSQRREQADRPPGHAISGRRIGDIHGICSLLKETRLRHLARGQGVRRRSRYRESRSPISKKRADASRRGDASADSGSDDAQTDISNDIGNASSSLPIPFNNTLLEGACIQTCYVASRR